MQDINFININTLIIMKYIISKISIIAFCSCLLFACKKDLQITTMQTATPSVITLSPATVVLAVATANDTVETISFTPTKYGFSAAVTYAVQVAKLGTNFATPTQVNVGNKTELKYLGAGLNQLAIVAGIAPGTVGQLEVRIKASLSDSLFTYSAPVTLTVTPYQDLYPALLVKGGNGWKTPATRTNGFLLTAVNTADKYEGYINLPNADGYGGDAMQLIATTNGTVYGWGGTSNTIAAGASGNLWLTVAPNYMKVNVDVTANTINFVATQFYISGDDNSWSTSATPMTLNTTTNQLEAKNVSLTAGKTFVFTSNGNYNISYKVDAAGKLIFAGPPSWAGNNIPITKTGIFTVILDLSAGDGSYAYKIQ
jgi:starch-binding outer membrane protein SusE/F